MEKGVRYVGRNVGALPLVKGWLEKLGIAQIIDDILSIDPKTKLSYGKVTEIMVANRLCSPKPLYEIEHWAKDTLAGLLFQVETDLLNDDRLGRTLDILAENSAILKGDIAIAIATKFGIGLDLVHWDLTDIEVHGEYSSLNEQEDTIKICYTKELGGKVKKAFKMGLDVASDGKGPVPISYDIFDGNISGFEATIHNMETLKRCINVQKIVRVSDRGCYSAEVVARTIGQGFDLISSIRITSAIEEKILNALNKGSTFKRLSFMSEYQRRKKQESARDGYSAFEIPHQEEYDGKIYPVRLIIVNSDGKLKRDRKTRQKHMHWIQKQLDNLAEKVGKPGYGIKRVQNAIKKIIERHKEGELFNINLEVDRKRPKSLTYSIDQAKLNRCSILDGIYALSTTLPKESYSMDKVFTLYKFQHTVEGANRILKSPLKVKPVFLHKPSRIEGLMFILWLALLSYMLLERICRQDVRSKSLGRVTARRILKAFEYYTIVEIQTGEVAEFHLCEFNQRQQDILNIIGIQVSLGG